MRTRVLLTVSEAGRVLAGLRCQLTARQIRYLGLIPSQRWSGGNGARLFDDVDVTLLAVFAQLLEKCREWELPIWSARAAVHYREIELRRAIARRTPRFLIVDPLRGTAVLSETADKGTHAIDLRELAGRIAEAARTVRIEEPEIWTGAERVSIRDVVNA